ncbi:MAG: hypothetical protein EGQ16_02640, partial [Clostridiales bacterium]|nr:hypothetical protein [Clostridiales bacterium]
DSNFESDLVNSYAWDTAIVFLQEFDNRADKTKVYSLQNSLNGSLANTGTNNSTTKDTICNIYDMASNCLEYSTETNSDSDYPCVFRGGNYHYSNSYTSGRGSNDTSGSYDDCNFRPLLYL